MNLALFLSLFSMVSLKSPDLDPLIFYRLLYTNLEEGVVHQFYSQGHYYFLIVDFVLFRPYNLEVSRMIYTPDFPTGTHSRAILRMPKGRSIEDLDTSRWEIDKTAQVSEPYENAMVDAIFASGAVPRRKDAHANFLSIGLGGGTITSYMKMALPNFNITSVEINPSMVEIAKDWFSFNTSENCDVVVEDGAVFLEYAVNNSLKYDVIFLDASHSIGHYPIFSPVAVFYEDKQMQNMAKLIGDDGVLIINVLFGDGENGAINSNYIVGRYQKYFKHIELRKLENLTNLILIARQKESKFTPRKKLGHKYLFQ